LPLPLPSSLLYCGSLMLAVSVTATRLAQCLCCRSVNGLRRITCHSSQAFQAGCELTTHSRLVPRLRAPQHFNRIHHTP
jgi:hypothetical protein